jgi:hypothetical protein
LKTYRRFLSTQGLFFTYAPYVLTPSEALKSGVWFQDEKIKARKNRLMMNQKIECCERD